MASVYASPLVVYMVFSHAKDSVENTGEGSMLALPTSQCLMSYEGVFLDSGSLTVGL